MSELCPFEEKLFEKGGWGIDWRQIAACYMQLPHETQLQLIAIIEAMPHGSGIDSIWRLSQNKSYYCLHNSYHAMDDNGYYCGWADFTVKIPKSAIGNTQTTRDSFQLQFNGRLAQYLNTKHDLRPYLEDTIAYCLEDVAAVSP